MIQIENGRAIVSIPGAGRVYVDSKGERYCFTGNYFDDGLMRLYQSWRAVNNAVIYRRWTLREYQRDRAKKILRKRG